MKASNSEKRWIFIIILMAGIVIGGLLGKIALGIPSLWWLNYGSEFGLVNPLTLDLNVLKLQFGFTIKITVSSIIGMIIGIFSYYWIVRG